MYQGCAEPGFWVLSVLDTEPTEQPSGSAVHGAEPPSLWEASGYNFIWGNSAQDGGGSGGMAIFLNATVAIATARAAGGQENRVRGPWHTGTMAFLGPVIPSCIPGRHLCLDLKGSKLSFHEKIWGGYRNIFFLSLKNSFFFLFYEYFLWSQ